MSKKEKKKTATKKPVKKKSVLKNPKTNVHRFAHPFYTDVPVHKRKTVPGVGNRMTDYIATKLEQIPAPLREPTMILEEIIGKTGASEIEQSGSITFHATGDTGEPKGDTQQMVADAMSA